MPDPVAPDADAEPTSPRFVHRFEVEAEDIDVNGHANNVVFVRWIQDAAVAHWYAAVGPALAHSLSWAVVRHEIDYRRPALRGDRLIAETWVVTITAATCERYCVIRREIDGVLLAESRTVWCGFDPQTGRPRRIDPAIRTAFLHGPSALADESAPPP